MTEPLLDTHLGQYHLIELIGRGGMAAVYKATQETLGRFVAVKVLSRQDDPEFAKRFKAEARATAHLQHPHILQIYDYGEQDGKFYLVLQYVENSTTLDDLTGEALPITQAVPLIIRLLAALEYAHSRGVIHRDIKPANVLLPSSDWPLLTDFGIAKLLGETGPRLTATGLIVGTPAYIAPEQAMGYPVDARTDLYAVGVILYEMLVGVLPFSADSSLGMLLKHVNDPPPSPRLLNPRLPAAVEPVLLRALAKRPEDRYRSAHEMADDLQRLLLPVDSGTGPYGAADLYQNGVHAFDQQEWTDAITHLSQLQMIAPGYKDSADLLTAAQYRVQGDPNVPIARSSTASSLATRGNGSRSTASQSSSAHTIILAPLPGDDAPKPVPAVMAPRSSASPAPQSNAAPIARGRSKGQLGVIIGLVALILVIAFASFLFFRQRPGVATNPPATAVAQATSAATALAPAATLATNGQAAAPTIAPVLAGLGSLTWDDNVLKNDAISMKLENVPPLPDGQVYAVWLSSKDRSLALGNLQPGANGQQTLTFVSPTQENLIADFDRVYITKVPASVASVEVANVIMIGALPPQALVHIRHVLFSFDSTPNKIGFGIGMIREVEEVIAHTDLLQQAQAAGNLDNERIHAEHLVNIIEGQGGEHFGDLNGDGKIQNPGDGFGLLKNGSQNGYVQSVMAHALLAAAASDATDEMKPIADIVQIAGANVHDRETMIRDLALKINQATSAADTKADVETIIQLAKDALGGKDANGDGRIDPIAGEGGALVAYRLVQQMATISIESGTVIEAAPPGLAPTATAAGSVVAIADNSFGPRKIALVVGQTIVWNNGGPSAHTVSAEDKSFDSGTLSNGTTFSHTFDQPGTYPYFCQFHGGPHGEGMSGTVIVNAKP